MKVFLSWSGDESRLAATAFHNWLPYLINAAKPWMSTDIDAGARWNDHVQRELAESRIGVIVVTRDNITAPWLLFEAGALAKTIDNTFVCPYLVGLKPADIPSGPLSQFQAKPADEPGTWDLVQTINKKLEEDAIDEERLKIAFRTWWPKLNGQLAELRELTKTPAAPRPVEDMVAEILTLVRGARKEKDSRSGEQRDTPPTKTEFYGGMSRSGVGPTPYDPDTDSDNA